MDPVFDDFSDEILCKRAVSGDAGAEEALILRHTRLVRATARPLFLAGGDSEDLMQEGFLGLLDAIRQFRPDRDASFRTFAQTCVRNRLFSAVRSAQRNKHLALNSSVSLEGTDLGADRSPEEQLIAREGEEERLEALKARLSPLEREVLGYYLDGLTYEEIAQVTHKSAKSVDNAVQRIRHKLARP